MEFLFCKRAMVHLRRHMVYVMASKCVIPHFIFPISQQRCLHNTLNHPPGVPETPKQATMSCLFLSKSLHSVQESSLVASDAGPEADVEEETDDVMNEFLSRFVHIIRGKLLEVYPTCDKETIDAMLLVICQKVVAEMETGRINEMLDLASNIPSLDLSQDLWKTIWEVSKTVLEDMRKQMRKEQMKQFVQSEDVKEMCCFARDIGIRGDMLRELRFKWAREKLEESEFYQSLDLLREQISKQEAAAEGEDGADENSEGVETRQKVVSLPQRCGKIKYKIYGLDLSASKWEEVADKIHEGERYFAPDEPKEITGKCKMVTSKILNLKEGDDLSPLLAEWVQLLRPAKVDWIGLLDRLKGSNLPFYFKVAELVLDEESFEANCNDHTKLIDAYAKENRVDDAERILQKMSGKGINPDVLTSTVLVHMYSKANNLECAKNAFERLRSQGVRPDLGIYTSMIMAYVKGGEPKSGELLMREMEGRGIKPTKEIYMELLKAFSHRGHIDGAQKMFTSMNYAGIQPSLEMYALLLEAYGHVGDPDQAKISFDEMRKLVGHKPDDRCTASMIAAYEKKNLLDKAVGLLLDLEREGFKPGVATYSVMVDWLGKLQLVDEAEQLLSKIRDGNNPLPFKLQISLCDMYSRAGNEKRALEAVRSVESQKEMLTASDFERLIHGLLAGRLVEDAMRVHELMQKQGFPSSEPLKVSLMAAQAMPRAVSSQRPKAK